MRHGEAEPIQVSDESRQLTELGKKQSRQSGIWINQFCQSQSTQINHAWVSPYTRTQMTFKELGHEVAVEKFETSSDIIPSSDPELTLSYLDVFAQENSDIAGMLLVSHMPFVSYFLDVVCQHHFSMLFSAGAIATVKYEPGQGPARLVGQFLPE